MIHIISILIKAFSEPCDLYGASHLAFAWTDCPVTTHVANPCAPSRNLAFSHYEVALAVPATDML